MKIQYRVMAEHQWVYRHHFGLIPPGFLVHHINRNPDDNRPENLVLVTRSQHFKLHDHPRRGTGVGRMVGRYYRRPGRCVDCGEETRTCQGKRCRSCARRKAWKDGVYERSH